MITIDKLLKVTNQLLDDKNKINEKLKETFIKFLSSIGENDIIKSVEENGLPSIIITPNDDLFNMFQKYLSPEITIFKNELTETNDILLFWK